MERVGGGLREELEDAVRVEGGHRGVLGVLEELGLRGGLEEVVRAEGDHREQLGLQEGRVAAIAETRGAQGDRRARAGGAGRSSGWLEPKRLR